MERTESMTDHICPLCTEPYRDRTNLQVHLEVEHRKSAVVSYLLDEAERAVETERPTEKERPAPIA